MENKLETVWNTVLTDFKPTVSNGNFNAILKPTALLSLEDDIATIAAPSKWILEIIQKRFADQIKEHLTRQIGKDVDLLFIIKTIPLKKKSKSEVSTLADGPLFTQDQKTTEPIKPFVGHLPRVRPDFTFDTFAVSSTNQLAFISSQQVAKKIGHVYNPLFIYGPVGVGKTHLMHAIANETYQKDPAKKIIYITSEEFTNEVVEAIRNNDTAKMKKRFRSAYILIIDDIQFIEGKEKVQEELFHTFNILIDNGAQICLTSDRPPQEIKKLQSRLSSRFAGGLTVDIGEPDLELKTAILKKKAEKFGLDLPTDVALFLADQATDSRTLEGLLLRMITQAKQHNLPITEDLAKKILGATIKDKRSTLHADDVIARVCDFYQIKTTQLKGPKRDASLVKARQVCMYLLKVELSLPLTDIGGLLGGRDHTTIMYGVDKIRKFVENKAIITEDILGITKLLRG
jgi:chromosomal replication initiator protein